MHKKVTSEVASEITTQKRKKGHTSSRKNYTKRRWLGETSSHNAISVLSKNESTGFREGRLEGDVLNGPTHQLFLSNLSPAGEASVKGSIFPAWTVKALIYLWIRQARGCELIFSEKGEG